MSLCAFLVFAFFCLVPSVSPALDAEISPDTLRQGDPFVLTVRSNPGRPEARLNGSVIALGPCGKGCFMGIGAVGPDAEPGTYEVEIKEGAAIKSVRFRVLDAGFPEIRMTLPEDKVFLSPEDQKRADRETGDLLALFGRSSPEPYWEGPFIMPLDNEVSTGFGVRRIFNGKKTSVHRGVDIRGAESEQVLASNTGRVVYTEDTFYGGNTLIIDHGLGVYSVYLHLSRISVAMGQHVRKGEVVGLVGSTGRSTGPHLHFGIKVNAVTTNPMSTMMLRIGGP